MTSQGYRDWLAAGRPYTLIRPAAALVRTLQGYGLTVYGLGPPNAAHLEANTPEDHTPFSVTGWPGTNRRWNARGVDVMPRSGSYAHRKENADIARQLIRDRDAGVPGAMWIKYLNWTDEAGICRQERWMNAAAPLQHTTRSSSDKGHIHISGRSDVDNDDRADGYDPIARMNGDDMTPEQHALLERTERILSAMCTRLLPDPGAGESSDRTQIVIKPWPGGPAALPNPVDRLIREFAALDGKLGTPVDGEVLEAEPIDLDALADKVAARLGDAFADLVADKLAARLAS